MLTTQQNTVIRINRIKIKALVNEYIKSADAINLVCVTDKQNGIRRDKNGDEFIYLFSNKKLKIRISLKE